MQSRWRPSAPGLVSRHGRSSKARKPIWARFLSREAVTSGVRSICASHSHGPARKLRRARGTGEAGLSEVPSGGGPRAREGAGRRRRRRLLGDTFASQPLCSPASRARPATSRRSSTAAARPRPRRGISWRTTTKELSSWRPSCRSTEANRRHFNGRSSAFRASDGRMCHPHRTRVLSLPPCGPPYMLRIAEGLCCALHRVIALPVGPRHLPFSPSRSLLWRVFQCLTGNTTCFGTS